MARSLKITPKVGEEILRLSTEYSQRQIAEKLREKHGVQLSHTAIAKFIKAQRWERSAQTKAIVRERSGRFVLRQRGIIIRAAGAGRLLPAPSKPRVVNTDGANTNDTNANTRTR